MEIKSNDECLGHSISMPRATHSAHHIIRAAIIAPYYSLTTACANHKSVHGKGLKERLHACPQAHARTHTCTHTHTHTHRHRHTHTRTHSVTHSHTLTHHHHNTYKMKAAVIGETGTARARAHARVPHQRGHARAMERSIACHTHQAQSQSALH